MPDLDRRFLIVLSVTAVVVLLAGFAMGRVTAGSSDTSSTEAATGNTDTTIHDDANDANSTATTQAAAIDGDASSVLPEETEIPASGVPQYGTDAERDQMLDDLLAAGVGGGTRAGQLATADHVCFNLERLKAQKRSVAYAVRIVWNESLGDLPSEDLAAFAVIFNAAPRYLCTDYVDYGDSISYWLGF